MIIKGYGIELERLKEEHLETVRRWRNADHVRRKMQFRGEITAEMQQEWFSKINTLEHNYFVIIVDQVSIGVINGSGIDWKEKITKSGGIFIGDQSYLNTRYPMAASLLITDLSVLCGFSATFIEVLDSNKKAQTYNRLFGYEKLEAGNTPGVSAYKLDHSTYLRKRKILRDLYFTKNEYCCPRVHFSRPLSTLDQFYIAILRDLQDLVEVNIDDFGV